MQVFFEVCFTGWNLKPNPQPTGASRFEKSVAMNYDNIAIHLIR